MNTLPPKRRSRLIRPRYGLITRHSTAGFFAQLRPFGQFFSGVKSKFTVWLGQVCWDYFRPALSPSLQKWRDLDRRQSARANQDLSNMPRENVPLFLEMEAIALGGRQECAFFTKKGQARSMLDGRVVFRNRFYFGCKKPFEISSTKCFMNILI